MNVKLTKRKKISSNLIKRNVKFELNDCEIKNDLFYVKKRLYVSKNEKLYTILIQHIHDFSFDEHANKTITYNKFNIYYY